LYISSEVSFFKIKPEFVVSGNPPLLLIIVAQPLLAASKLVLPNGSSQREQITEMLAFSKNLKFYYGEYSH
jgi:hypothetical protein